MEYMYIMIHVCAILFACDKLFIFSSSELLNCNWKKKDKEELAPNVCRMIRRTNEVIDTNEKCLALSTIFSPSLSLLAPR